MDPQELYNQFVPRTQSDGYPAAFVWLTSTVITLQSQTPPEEMEAFLVTKQALIAMIGQIPKFFGLGRTEYQEFLTAIA
jgi:hypothetical protein